MSVGYALALTIGMATYGLVRLLRQPSSSGRQPPSPKWRPLCRTPPALHRKPVPTGHRRRAEPSRATLPTGWPPARQ